MFNFFVISLVFVLSTNVFSQENKTFPFSVNLLTVEGETINSSELLNNNQYLFLDFWTSWCSPCIKMFDAVSDNFEEWNTNSNCKIIAIACEKPSEANLKLIKEKQWPFEVYYDPDEILYKELCKYHGDENIQVSFPTVFVFNKNWEMVDKLKRTAQKVVQIYDAENGEKHEEMLVDLDYYYKMSQKWKYRIGKEKSNKSRNSDVSANKYVANSTSNLKAKATIEKKKQDACRNIVWNFYQLLFNNHSDNIEHISSIYRYQPIQTESLLSDSLDSVLLNSIRKNEMYSLTFNLPCDSILNRISKAQLVSDGWPHSLILKLDISKLKSVYFKIDTLNEVFIEKIYKPNSVELSEYLLNNNFEILFRPGLTIEDINNALIRNAPNMKADLLDKLIKPGQIFFYSPHDSYDWWAIKLKESKQILGYISKTNIENWNNYPVEIQDKFKKLREHN